MAKLDWEASNRRNAWAYQASTRSKPIGAKSPAYAHAARFYSEISAVTRQIKLGHELIDQLPCGDPRYGKWQRRLTALYQERRRLRNS